MRTLAKNTQSLHYATFVSKTEIKDEYENPTGQYQITYSAPVAVNWNVRGVESDAEVQMFGILAKDTIRVVAEKPLPIDEASIIWFGTDVPDPYNPVAPGHNYRIAGIPPTLNDAVFYAVKVDTGYVAPEPEEPEEPEGDGGED
jgi:hypothetical protein